MKTDQMLCSRIRYYYYIFYTLYKLQNKQFYKQMFNIYFAKANNMNIAKSYEKVISWKRI